MMVAVEVDVDIIEGYILHCAMPAAFLLLNLYLLQIVYNNILRIALYILLK